MPVPAGSSSAEKPKDVFVAVFWGVVGIILIAGAYWKVLPWTGISDKAEMSGNDVITLALQSAQFFQGLAAASMGGTLLLLGQEEKLRDVAQRNLKTLLTGFVFLALSLLTGFLVAEAMFQAALQSLVLQKVAATLFLRLLQLAFLLVGVCLIGFGLFWQRLTRGRALPVTE